MSITNEHVLPEYNKFTSKLVKAVEHLKQELLSLRAGRANPNVLDKVMVDYWGTPTRLKEMANITVPEPRMLLVAPYDVSALKSINKAILEADLGLNPSDDGKSIRLVFPQLTEERRKDLIKGLKKTIEDSKVVLRNERRDMIDAIKKLKKDNHVTEDEVVFYEKEVQKELDKNIDIVDKLAKDKEKEITEI